MVWSEAECHDTDEQELKEPPDDSQKRVMQASGEEDGFKRKISLDYWRLPRRCAPQYDLVSYGMCGLMFVFQKMIFLWKEVEVKEVRPTTFHLNQLKIK